MKEIISTRRIQHFMKSNSVVSWAQTVKFPVCRKKEEFINREVELILRKIMKEFNAGNLVDEQVCNADETHFLFYLHNYRTLDIRGEEGVKCKNVLSGDEGFTIMICINGRSSSSLGSQFAIFQNPKCSYLIHGLSESMLGFLYRTGKKGWMDRRVFIEWLENNFALGNLPDGKKRGLLAENCVGNVMKIGAWKALSLIKTNIRYLPKNSTDFTHPADSFDIKKVNTSWCKRWEEIR